MKGTIAYDMMQLPGYWLKMNQSRKRQLKARKIPFGKHPRQYLIYWEGIEDHQERPLIFYIHGGAWTFGKPEWFWAKAEYFYQLGFDVLMPSHRRLPNYHHQDMQMDIEMAFATGLQYLRQSGWKSQEVIIGGMSSGGNLAALLVGNQEAFQMKYPDISIKQLLLFGAPLVLNAMPKTWGLQQYRVGDANSIHAGCPFSQWSDVPSFPTFAVHGGKDGLVPWSAVKPFYDWLKAKQSNLQLHYLADGTHLDSTSWAFPGDEMEQLLSEFLKK